MTQHVYYVNGMECQSCSRVISKVVERFPGAGLLSADSQSGKIVLEFQDGDEQEILRAVAERGYALSDKPVGTGAAGLTDSGKNGLDAAWAFAAGAITGKPGFETERRLLEQSLLSFFTVIALGIAAVFMFPAGAGYKTLFALLAFAAAANGFAIWHSIAYRREFTCTSGMMVGMTVGMMSGFMVGAIVGATNGMLVGSVAGMLVGMLVGGYSGACCGIMGALEGLMAGIMAGLMGAMTSVMLFNDDIVLFLYFLFASCGLVLAGLSYMVWKEAGGKAGKAPSTAIAVLLNAAVAGALMLLMISGPRGPIYWVAGG